LRFNLCTWSPALADIAQDGISCTLKLIRNPVPGPEPVCSVPRIRAMASVIVAAEGGCCIYMEKLTLTSMALSAFSQ